MSDYENSNNNMQSPSSKKNTKKSKTNKALKALVPVVAPMMAMAAPVANASVRSMGSVSRKGQNGKAAAVVHVPYTESSLTISGVSNAPKPDAISQQPKRSAFSAFGGTFIGNTTNIESATNRQPSNAAMEFLANNDLLNEGELAAGKISGDTGAKFGAKTFLGAGLHSFTSYHAYSWCGSYTYISSGSFGYLHLTSRTNTASCTSNGGNWFTYSSVTTDTTAPNVTSVSVTGGQSAPERSVGFTVYFDEYINNVSTDDFTLTTLTGSVSGNISFVNAYNDYAYVHVNNLSGTGNIRLDVNANTNIIDNYGNGYGTNGYVPSFTEGAYHAVDTDEPYVSSITVSGTPAQNAASMDFIVDFDDGPYSVSGAYNVSTDDFTVTTYSGTAAGTVSNVSSSNGDPITVTVSSISGTGSIRLDLNGYTDITDAVGNGDGYYGEFASPFSSGSTHTVDRDIPATPAIPDLDVGSDTGVNTADNNTSDDTPTLSGTAEALSTVTLYSSVNGNVGSVAAGAGGAWTITASALTPNVAHNMTVTATDAASNVSGASSALAVTLDTADPLIASVVRLAPASSPTSLDSVTWRVTFNEDVFNVDPTDFSVTGTTGTVSAVTPQSATVYDVTVSGGDMASLDATATLVWVGTGLSDRAGNNMTNPTPTGTNDNTFVIDNTGPTTTITAPAVTVGAFDITVTFAEAVTGFTSGEITATNGTVSAFAGSGTTYTATVTPITPGVDTVVSVAAAVAIDGLSNTNLVAIDAVVANNNIGTVDIDGTAGQGQTLFASVHDIDGASGTFTYQWMSDGGNVGSDSSSYLVQASDVGKQISVNVTYTDDLGTSEDITSTSTAAVLNLAEGAEDFIEQGVGGFLYGLPTVADYENAGVVGVTEAILYLVNNAVINQNYSLDSVAEIQVIVDEVLEGQDNDGDGIPNLAEGTGDTDGDGILDRDDIDSDNDGISDTVETGLDLTDTDGDGIIDMLDADVDNDGVIDLGKSDFNFDGVDNSLDTPFKLQAAFDSINDDTDKQANHLDIDSDNDGILDMIEAGFTDADGDGLLDIGGVVITDATLLADTDDDGAPDTQEPISDGITTDRVVAGFTELLDFNGDGIIDNAIDMDNDGLIDIVDGAVGFFGTLPDADGDGLANYSDPDADNDTFTNGQENSQLPFFTGIDSDGDGIDDGVDAEVDGETFGTDADANGVQDDRELADADGDGTADWLDDDSDNNGINDGEDARLAAEAEEAAALAQSEDDADVPAVPGEESSSTGPFGSLGFVFVGLLIAAVRRLRLKARMK